MRNDMIDVVKEGKRSRGNTVDTYRNRYKVDLEDSPSFEKSNKRSSSESYPNVRSQPIFRWLLTKVGCSWSEVYSEFCSIFKHKQLVRRTDADDMLDWSVHRNVTIVDGEVFDKNNHSLSNRWRSGKVLYVHPTTNKLECIDAKRYEYKKPEPEYLNVVEIEPRVTPEEWCRVYTKDWNINASIRNMEYRGYKLADCKWYTATKCFEGIWYRVEYIKPAPKVKLTRYDLWFRHTPESVYSKRQLNSAELKKLKLKNTR